MQRSKGRNFKHRLRCLSSRRPRITGCPEDRGRAACPDRNPADRTAGNHISGPRLPVREQASPHGIPDATRFGNSKAGLFRGPKPPNFRGRRSDSRLKPPDESGTGFRSHASVHLESASI
ncbi:hypothetical protein Sfum_3939 [Syntrophobacter fumaroxidans MPOB]|uniref:Uncharacterized protein n=1 Tax=Syntrophobacter fumaroxidans (strain DSM 10017 / MPOB) TaxID=335543 RepID=A0LQA6_SYNFM|nr:hypothetical protein Sfum_3939 [Syntrophobacter fumaroxidans MPOB]